MLLFLNYQQELIDKYIEAEPASVATGSSKLDSSMSGIPERAPHEIILDDFPSDKEDVPADCEFATDFLYLIPDPCDDLEMGSHDDSIKYTIRENATRVGNPVIEDSHGFTYNFQRKSKHLEREYCLFFSLLTLFTGRWPRWQQQQQQQQ